MGVHSAAADRAIERNLVGTDPSGAVARANCNGVVVSGARCHVVNNVISGNSSYGVTVGGSHSPEVVIAGNSTRRPAASNRWKSNRIRDV